MRTEAEIKNMIELAKADLEILSKENQYDELITGETDFRHGVISALEYVLGYSNKCMDELRL